jgi:hypothetical protein
MFSLFKKSEDQSDSEQIASFKKEMLFIQFSSGMSELPKPCDQIPEGQGEFGRSETNPVPVNGVEGARIYLNRLRSMSGSGIFYHRISSISPKGVPFMVDKYHVVTAAGDFETFLYICPYYPRRSLKAPAGFKLMPWSEVKENKVTEMIVMSGASGAPSERIEDFPFGLDLYFKKKFSKTDPQLGDALCRIMGKLLDKNWYEDAVRKNDSGDLISVRVRKKIIKLA